MPARSHVLAEGCPYCQSLLGCAVDCSNAPWNFDKDASGSRLVYLLRQRRWVGSPVDGSSIFWVTRLLSRRCATP